MTINVLDTHTQMKRILAAEVCGRVGLLRSMLEPMTGMFRYFPGEVDLVDMHRQSFGFPLDRDEEQCREALETLAEADAWGRMQRALDEALSVQMAAVPGLETHDITVLLTLGDPGDAHFMETILGVSGNGGIAGYIVITIWPFSENLERLEATVAHELNHNLRYGPGGAQWDPATVTVGEHVVSEGLADAFARQLYGDLGYTRIGAAHLDDDKVFSKVITGLEVTGMENFTAWVHGDDSAKRFGVEPVGLPTGAGYAAGNRMVDAYLAATGQTAAQALHADAAAIIAMATLKRQDPPGGGNGGVDDPPTGRTGWSHQSHTAPLRPGRAAAPVTCGLERLPVLRSGGGGSAAADPVDASIGDESAGHRRGSIQRGRRTGRSVGTHCSVGG